MTGARPQTETTTTALYDEYYDEGVEAETMDPEELAEMLAEQVAIRLDALNSKAMVREIRVTQHFALFKFSLNPTKVMTF